MEQSNFKDMSPAEAEALVRRLNTSHAQKEAALKAKYNFNHAFINKKILTDFSTKLETEANNTDYITGLLNSLNDVVLDFFITKQHAPDPNTWKKHEAAFGKLLLDKNISASRCKKIVQLTNRFLKFLHDQYDNEVRLLKLEPLSKSVLKRLKSESPNNDRVKFIDDKEYKYICKNIDLRILPMVKISYCFGLRLAETLGLRLDDVYEDMLNVDRQLIKVNPVKTYTALKNKEKRQVPYWYCNPEDIYKLIQEVEEMHPDTLCHLFASEIKRLSLTYQFHDLRRTWVTNSLRNQNYRDVQLAAGHEDLKTTMLYAQDDRRLSRKKYVPI